LANSEIEQLATEIVARLGWSEEAAFLGLRARFCCEYCDRPLLRSIEDYDTWQNAHVLPRSRGGSEDYRAKKAMACKTCNFMKRHTLLNEPVTDLDRDQLIQRYREVFQERRRRKAEELATVRAVFRELHLSPEGLSD
jgi:hypothetical protein